MHTPTVNSHNNGHRQTKETLTDSQTVESCIGRATDRNLRLTSQDPQTVRGHTDRPKDRQKPHTQAHRSSKATYTDIQTHEDYTHTDLWTKFT